MYIKFFEYNETVWNGSTFYPVTECDNGVHKTSILL